MVFVVLSGLPLDVDPKDLAMKINTYFGENKEIGTFRMNIDDSDIRKPKAVLKFKQGFDAMEAQRLLDNFKYSDPDDKMIYNIKAIVPTNDQPYISLFSEETADIADVIKSEKQKRKKEKKAKKRKHSPIDKDKSDRLSLPTEDLDAADVKKLEKLYKKLKKKREKAERLSQSDRSASESEHKRGKRDKSILGESSGVAKRPRTPEDPVKNYRKLSSYSESSRKSTSTIREGSRSTSVSISPKSSDSRRESLKRPHTPEDMVSPSSYKREYRRPSESRSSDERKYRPEHFDIKRETRDYRSSSRHEPPFEDLRYKMEARRPSVRESRPRDYERYYTNRAPVDSPRTRKPLYAEGSSRLNKERHSSESTDPEYSTANEIPLVKKLLLLEPSFSSNYLEENDPEFKQAVAHIIHTVATNMDRLQEEDKQLIIDNFTETVVNRLKSQKFTKMMSVQDIVLDYKLVYKTADDKLLINKLIKELQAMGKGILLPEIKKERLGQAIDEVLEDTNIDELIEDVKPEIKTEDTLEYEYEDEETTEVINIVVNLVPIEKRDLPMETDPEKISDIKEFVSNLKKTKPAKFFRPIRSLLNEMKLFMYNNCKVVPSEVILNRMVIVLEKMLTRMLGPVKTKMKAKQVCNLFRHSFPYKEDKEFVDMIVQWILNGEFEKGVDGLVKEKIKLPKVEPTVKTEPDSESAEQNTEKSIEIKEEISEGSGDTNIRIKTEPPEDTDTTMQSLPVPIKMETPDNEDETEQTTTKTCETVEQTTTAVQMEEQRTILEYIDGSDDVCIKKEPVDVITIDDDDIVAKQELIDDYNKTPEIKQESTIISDSEEEGALSDDSRTTQIIERKPDFDTEFDSNTVEIHPIVPTNEVAGNIDKGAPDETVKNEPDETVTNEPKITGETIGTPGGMCSMTIHSYTRVIKRDE